MFVCLSAPRLLKLFVLKEARIINRISPTAFQFLYDTCYNITDWCGLSNKKHHKFLPKESKVTLRILAIHLRKVKGV